MPTPIEDEFIRRARKRDDSTHTHKLKASLVDGLEYEFARCKLIVYASVSTWHITPRGLDLLATAAAIGYEPPLPVAPEPATRPCPDCKEGRREVQAWQGADPETECVWDCKCETCEGSGRVQFREVAYHMRISMIAAGKEALGARLYQAPISYTYAEWQAIGPYAEKNAR